MNFTSHSVTISKAEARALLAHAEKEGRVNMDAVFFDGRDLIAMATDSYRTVIARGTGDVSEWRTLVPRRDLEAVLVGRVVSLTITTDETGLTGTIAAYDKRGKERKTVSFAWPTIETRVDAKTKVQLPAVFPSIKLCTPRAEERGALAGIDARFLADVALVQDAAREENGYAITAYCPPADALSPHKFVVGAWTVTIMPCRLGMLGARTSDVMREIRETETAIGPARDNGPRDIERAKAA